MQRKPRDNVADRYSCWLDLKSSLLLLGTMYCSRSVWDTCWFHEVPVYWTYRWWELHVVVTQKSMGLAHSPLWRAGSLRLSERFISHFTCCIFILRCPRFDLWNRCPHPPWDWDPPTHSPFLSIIFFPSLLPFTSPATKQLLFNQNSECGLRCELLSGSEPCRAINRFSLHFV